MLPFSSAKASAHLPRRLGFGFRGCICVGFCFRDGRVHHFVLLHIHLSCGRNIAYTVGFSSLRSDVPTLDYHSGFRRWISGYMLFFRSSANDWSTKVPRDLSRGEAAQLQCQRSREGIGVGEFNQTLVGG